MSVSAPLPTRHLGTLVLSIYALALVGGCREATTGEAADFAVSTSPQAMLVLEPDRLALGQVLTAEVVVVTPPEHRVLPIPMTKLPGLWLLGARALPPEPAPHRWVHRTQFRVRPRELGRFTWPTTEVVVEGPDGASRALAIEARGFEVVGQEATFPGRTQPFGLQQPVEASGSGVGFGLGFTLGFALAVVLAALALWLRGRRRSSRRPEAEEVAVETLDLQAWSRQELSDALAALESDPSRAASIGAHLLRAYVAKRYDSPTRAATTEELERHEPALAERRLWPELVRLLHHFDDVRFRPHRQPEGARDAAVQQRIRAALEGTRALVESSRPSGPG